METTLAIIKPNGVKGGLIGEIISRYEKARLAVKALKLKTPTREEAAGFYQEHKEKPFFDELVGFMTSGPVVLIILEGENAIEKVRAINGATDPSKAMAGSIRHDFAPNITKNVVHASDSTKSAQRETGYWFKEEEKSNYSAWSQVRDV